MRREKIKKTRFVGFFMEPDLRSAIEDEAARQNIKMSRLVRAVLWEQIARLPKPMQASR